MDDLEESRAFKSAPALAREDIHTGRQLAAHLLVYQRIDAIGEDADLHAAPVETIKRSRCARACVVSPFRVTVWVCGLRPSRHRRRRRRTSGRAASRSRSSMATRALTRRCSWLTPWMTPPSAANPRGHGSEAGRGLDDDLDGEPTVGVGLTKRKSLSTARRASWRACKRPRYRRESIFRLLRGLSIA